MLLTQENPVGMWQDLPWVQQLATEHNWQLVPRVDHCMMVTDMDETYFPNKPTSYLVFNCEPMQCVECNNQCTQRLPSRGQRKYHRMLICNRSNMLPEQTVLTDVLEKGRIPLMVFGNFMARHLRHKQVHAHTSSQIDVAAEPPRKAIRVSVPHSVSESWHNRLIVRTAKQPRAKYIADRCDKLHGKSYDEAMDMQYVNSKGDTVAYKPADYRFDVQHGYIEHALLARQQASSEETHMAA